MHNTIPYSLIFTQNGQTIRTSYGSKLQAQQAERRALANKAEDTRIEPLYDTRIASPYIN